MDWVLSIVVVVAAPALIALAHAAGRHAGKQMTLPWRPIFQLVDHRVHCLGHDRRRVELELGDLLGIPAWAWPELLSLRRPLDRRRARSRKPGRNLS
jgi:hypothetical protein